LDARTRLIKQLQLAHAGERAAAYAYRGHWKSTRDRHERTEICRIENEEWEHRRRVGEMLRALGAKPAPMREARMTVIGRVVGALCWVSGWFFPMYGAGLIERRNVHEYLDAAVYARDAGRHELVDDLLTMAEVEHDHERWFRERLAGHWLLRVIPLWAPLPERASLRASFVGKLVA
jgi:demethoxyubiquinone hydroxylase (CLK1/Coq7/Cat5 family)